MRDPEFHHNLHVPLHVPLQLYPPQPLPVYNARQAVSPNNEGPSPRVKIEPRSPDSAHLGKPKSKTRSGSHTPDSLREVLRVVQYCCYYDILLTDTLLPLLLLLLLLLLLRLLLLLLLLL